METLKIKITTTTTELTFSIDFIDFLEVLQVSQPAENKTYASIPIGKSSDNSGVISVTLFYCVLCW